MAPASGVPSSGNPFIDHQHGRLNELLRIAAQAARDTADSQHFRRALTDFQYFLAHHFAVESLIISGAGFDAAARHGHIHAAILGRVDTILAALDELTTISLRHRTLDELEHILIDHEMLEDAAYWDALRAHAGVPVLKWSRLMVVGIDWLDRQHRRMVELFNELAEAAHAGDGALSSRLLEQFLYKAREHFMEEERQIAAWGEPLSAHRADHARMLAELDQLASIGDDPRLLVDHYLRFWMIDHILGLDLKDLGRRA